MSGTDPIHSTGRGGAGNIGHDPNKYADGGIVREGVLGESVDGNYSSGRGGAGNAVASPRVGPTAGRRLSHDKLPQLSKKDDPPETYHYGRGGAANVVGPDGHAKGEHHHEHAKGEHKESILDKAKHALHLDKKKEGGA